jgi:hypothetical protein
LEAVLLDLSRVKEDGLPLSLGRNAPRPIYYSPKADALRKPENMQDVRERLFAALSADHLALAKDAERQLCNQRAMNAALKSFVPPGRWIQRSPEGSRQEGLPYMAHFPVQISSVGFSRDGTASVVYLSFPELLHPSDGMCFLEHRNGRWNVVARRFVTYA